MKSIEFIYWLQGYFEISDNDEISKEQLIKINNHLKMAEITDGMNVHPFHFWLKGFLEAIETEKPSKNQTTTIKNKLNNLFDHVVAKKLNMEEKENFPLKTTGLKLNPSETSELIRC